MSKRKGKKKSGDKDRNLKILLLITAILNLIKAILEIIKKLLE